MMVKRSIVLSLILSLLAGAAVAERELSLGEYSAEVRGRVVEKVREALTVGGSDAEVAGVVTYAGGGFFFLQSAEDGLKVLAKGAAAKREKHDELEKMGLACCKNHVEICR